MTDALRSKFFFEKSMNIYKETNYENEFNFHWEPLADNNVLKFMLKLKHKTIFLY